ncbi:hypothetical protein SPRG_12373 [Saprolegnia parasitica CBS 223.65]|uniref:VLIG-type G domain-containing protein n=1 Tax=Saprolegnia parasitica (strain CBS 223.65) TaxID=695850 RepID=A0A067C5P5_SAPPC|nr:hypothetical protein SPRG_12373 [Saprolegnia parasitica CBS 223.65]KDO21871.1 hypothetical protein SPRG_12373 [Saprolegnia parasitica CBS 223.65]|eukprot:XP_012207426.1 hypothetical protein SPRG_12373 [Saprolegnia parasitica CBS 223.65]
MTENSVAMSYEELKCYHLLETVPRLDDGSEVFQPTLKELELYRLLRALSVVDANASPGNQLGHFIDACLNGVKKKSTCGDGVANADAASPEVQLGDGVDAVIDDAKMTSASIDAVLDADAVLSEGQNADAGLNTGTEPKKDEKVDADQSVNKATFNRSIDVVACYGKQAAVEADLRAQGWWPTNLETYLHADHEGVYAILLPETTDRPKLVLFTWLLDASFSPKYLRERATYALRFVTTLTPVVRCCLGDAEWDALERAAAETRAESSQKNTAVEMTITEAKVQEEHVSCEVASKPTKATPGDTLLAATGVTGVTMHISQDHYIRNTSESISIAPPADFAAWLLEAAKTHRLQIRVQLPSDCKRAVLEAMSMLPTEKLPRMTMESLVANLRDEAKAEAITMLAAITTKVIEAGATLFYLHDNVTAAEEASAHTALQEQKKVLQNTLSPAIELPTTFDPLVADVINAEYARLLVTDTSFLALAEKLPSLVRWYRSSRLSPTASLEFPLLKKHKPEMELILPRTQGVLRDSYKAWSQVVRAFLESDQVVNITTNQCYNKLVAKANCQETPRREKEAKIVHEAFVAAIEEANAKHAPTELSVYIDRVKPHYVDFSKEYVAGGATQLTLTPVGGAPFGSIKLPRDAVVVHVAFVAGARTVVVVVFTLDGKTHVQSYQANGARPMMLLVAKEFPKLVERCDFDASHRLLALQHSDTKVDIYAFSESFKVFTRAHRFNLQLLGPIAPYTTMPLFGGDNHGLFVVGGDGSAQSYYLRTQQQSKLVPDFATPGSKVVKLQNGAFMVRIEPLDNDQHPRRLRLHTLEIQSHAMLPLVAEVALPKTLKFFNWSTVQACAYDDTIVLLDQSSGAMLVLKMTVLTGKVGFEVSCTHSAAPVTATESHVLAPLFHVFEKFPVRAFMTRCHNDDDDSDDSEDEAAAKSQPSVKCDDADLLPMALQLHVQASSPKRCKAAARVLKAIMKKIKELNKRLASLSLAKDTVMNGDLVWPTMALGRWVLEVVGFVPVPICRARDNELELLRDGNVVTLSQCAEVHDMEPNIIFGPTSYILKAWRGPIVVITSMGKQSTGKSYFLNHLTGSSFAISGARCTDGVWLTLRPYGETLLVVLDFEGLGSFERSMQEDTLLSVLNAAISQLTIFRIEMRFDKDIDAMFAKFQQGVSMLKGDPRLFTGQLYMNAKDVNPNDTDTLVDEFRSKLAGLLKNATADNFLTVMYSGSVLVTACAPLNNVGYYHGLAQASTCLAEARDRKTFSSGASFHECLAYLLAKIARRDWTSMGDNIRAGKTKRLRKQLRYALRNGKLDAAITATSVNIWADDDDATVAERQAKGLADKAVPQDAEIDFGLELDGSTDAAANHSVVKATLLHYLGQYVQLVASHDEDHLAKAPRRVDHEAGFDVLWTYIVWRREHRVRAWFESLGGSSRQALQDDFNKCVQDVKQLLRRCEHTCSKCKLGCFESFMHDRAMPHDCGGSHRCEGRCAHCDDDAPCGAVAGHAGSCNCCQKSHTCPQVCHLATARNCDGNCHLDVDHVGPHVCSVNQHLCPKACEAKSCRNECYHLLDFAHDTHSCGTRRCQQRCSYVGCTGTCTSDDHFHAVGALHSCGQEHTCQAKCTAGGNCETKVKQETIRTKDRAKKKCVIKFQDSCIDHKGKDHRCDTKEHTCDVRCPCCNYYCKKPYQHTDPHATTHGSMIETTFVMDIAVLELETDRKYAAGDRGIAEMCPFFCSKLGRGHVHYMPCEHASADACTSAAKDGRRHSTMKLASNPKQAMDEVLHDTYWKALGWEDPVSSALERTKFASCPYECEAPEHKDAGSDKSYCVLGAWHEPVVNATTLKSGQFLVQGHVFKCRHIAAKGLQHHVFVLDASWSMEGESWQALTAAFHAYVAQILATRSQNCADIVSVVTFDTTARIVHEAQPLIKMAKISLPFSGGCTSYDAGLRCANEVLSRNDHKSYTPVMLFLSDGEPDSDANGVALAQSIAKSYSIYNLQSSFAETGADLLATFEEISVPEHIRAGLLGKATTTQHTNAA